jgi:hypothetical protein
MTAKEKTNSINKTARITRVLYLAWAVLATRQYSNQISCTLWRRYFSRRMNMGPLSGGYSLAFIS